MQRALKPPGVVAKLNLAMLDKEQQELQVICMPQKNFRGVFKPCVRHTVKQQTPAIEL